MNGKNYEEIIQTINIKIKEVKKLDKEAFCECALNMVKDLDHIQKELLFTDISYLMHSMSSNTFDDKAILHAQGIFDKLYLWYNRDLDRKIQQQRWRTKLEITRFRFSYRIIKFTNGVLQLIALLSSISLPFIINLPELPKYIPTIISISTAISIGLLKFYKFREHSKLTYQAAEKLSDEYHLYILAKEPYEKLTKGIALDHFIDRTRQAKHELNKVFLALEEKLAKEQEIELTQKKDNNKS